MFIALSEILDAELSENEEQRVNDFSIFVGRLGALRGPYQAIYYRAFSIGPIPAKKCQQRFDNFTKINLQSSSIKFFLNIVTICNNLA